MRQSGVSEYEVPAEDAEEGRPVEGRERVGLGGDLSPIHPDEYEEEER